MTFTAPPPPANAYRTGLGTDPLPEAGFEDALCAAVAATEAVQDLVVDPHPDRTAAPEPAAASFPAPPTPAPAATVVPLGPGRWRVQAATLDAAAAAAAELGPVDISDARTVARGLGPWRRAHVELTATTHHATVDTADPPAVSGTGAAAVGPERVSPVTAADDAPHAAPGTVPAPTPERQAVTAAEHVLSMLAAVETTPADRVLVDTAVVPADDAEVGDAEVAGDDDVLVPPPVLPPALPDCTDVDFPQALTALRLSERVIADAAELEPATAEDWVGALAVAFEDALSRAGAVDPDRGGYYVNGVGIAGAVALVNAASSGKAIGTLTWRGMTAPPSAQRLLCAVLTGATS